MAAAAVAKEAHGMGAATKEPKESVDSPLVHEKGAETQQKPRNLADGIRNLKCSASLCDVLLVVGDESFPAHQAMLSAMSPAFGTYIKEATPKQAVSEIEDFPIHVGGVTEGHNIITRIPGEEPDKLVIVGAHYDSIPARGPAQGAEDNGSGVATLLAVAEAVKNTPGCCKYSVEFIMFSGEEEGLLGSSAFVKDKMVGDAAQKVHGVIIMDEVAYARPERNHARHLIFETSGHSKDVERVIDTMAHAAQVSNKRSSEPDVLFEINYDGFASDHMSFLNRGIPAVLVIERDNMYYASKYGHTSRDTVANIDNGLGASVATIVAQATANLAGAKR